MGINLIIAVTDDDWFEILRRRPDIPEVNFLGTVSGKFPGFATG